VTATDLRKGMVINHEGELYVIVSAKHITPGNKRGHVQAKMKSLEKGNTYAHKFRSTNDIDRAFLDSRGMEYLYPEGEAFVFMDNENYEQMHLPAELVGDDMPYVKLNSQVKVTFHEGTPVSVDLPSSVVLEVTHTEPGFKGDTATNVTKPATLETGLEIRVPGYIKDGEQVKIDTRTGEFLERVK
jgi:elongation factor P